MRRAVRLILYLFLFLLVLLTLIAVVLSSSIEESFLDTLFFAWFFGGIVILGIALLCGSGISETKYRGSSLMSLSSTYSRTIMSEWSKRMWEQFDILIVGAILGFSFMGLGALLVYVPLAVIPCIVVLVLVMYFISRQGRTQSS